MVAQQRTPLIALSQSGTIAAWSPGAEAALSRTEAEAVGASFAELLVPAAQRVEFSTHLVAALEHGRSVFELPLRWPDGRTFPAVMALSLLPEPSGEAALDLNVIDATGLKPKAPAVGGDAAFRGLLEASPDAIVIVGPGGRIEQVNGQAEKVFGYSRGELMGQPVEVLVPRRSREAHEDHRAGYAGEPAGRPMSKGLALSGLRKDGTEFPAEIALAPLHTPSGTLTAAAIRDVTPLRRLEVALRQARRELEASGHPPARPP